jgi:hypothetical protein
LLLVATALGLYVFDNRHVSRHCITPSLPNLPDPFPLLLLLLLLLLLPAGVR